MQADVGPTWAFLLKNVQSHTPLPISIMAIKKAYNFFDHKIASKS